MEKYIGRKGDIILFTILSFFIIMMKMQKMPTIFPKEMVKIYRDVYDYKFLGLSKEQLTFI